jgi:hypothetical protein
MPAQKPSYTKNMAYVTLAGQAGCASLFLIFIALFAGLALDAHFHVRGPFTIGLLILSVPISLFAMVRIALGMIRQITPPPPAGGSSRENVSHTEEE